MRYKFTVYIWLFSIIVSCSENATEKHKKEMLNYLKNEHSLKINAIDNSTFLIINLNCINCLGRKNIEKSVSLSNTEINFIFVGKTHEKRILQIIKVLESQNKVLFDFKSKTKFYELNFSKSILFKIENGQIKNYIVYSGLNVKTIKNDILSIRKK